ncbi:hypothetical protein NUW58_g4151 [Xylaria curta]|uniref:Uncharacterized protein n=1 Tax=Xylaria curta TaxID=42375 RepID=A0ACC1PA85_9PEZI|nr:hypothetical protein NUW58_g4151 [Xylaria curta]
MADTDTLPENITESRFNQLLNRYAPLIESISSEKTLKAGQLSLLELDDFRYTKAVEAFRSDKPKRQMNHDDVKTLVDWKLRHGKFRPTLMKLVSSNDGAVVKKTIQEAMTRYWLDSDIAKAVDAIAKLKGVGPATASLLLSVHDPDRVIFFSDEAFRWLCCGGQKSPIKYNAKEYQQLNLAAAEIAEKLQNGLAGASIVHIPLTRRNNIHTVVLGKTQLDIETDSKMIRALQIVAALSLTGQSLCNPVPDQPVIRQDSTIDRSTLNGKFFVGYQAWFRKPFEGNGNSHWTTDRPTPEVGHVGVDMIPDVTGYPAECLFDTPFTRPDGSPAQFYSNDCNGVVDLHFKMMRDHGISGAFLQRFYGYINEPNGGWINILNAAKTAAEKHGRGFAIEYDLNGAATGSTNVTATFLADLAALSGITSSSAYMRHEGKPVIEIWGFGIANQVTANDGIAIVTALKNAGWYVILGVQQAWHAELVENQPGRFGPVYRLADMIQPWTVGSYDINGYKGFLEGRQAVEDAGALRSLGIDSSIVVWPGGSSSNANPNEQFDHFPRWNGSFYKMQLDGAVSLKPTFIFGAMFDEANEATSIFPVLRTRDLPTNQRFLGIDNDMAPDAYLQMAGDAASRFRALWQ